MDRLPQHDETSDEDDVPYLAEETDYQELRFDDGDDDITETDLERWDDGIEDEFVP